MNKKILISALFMIWIGLASAFSQGENIMIINDVTGEAGEIITVEIAIENDDAFVGFNLDIPFPDGFTYVPGSAVLYRDNGHSFSFTVPHSNTARIIAFSFTNAEFSGNEGVVMTFELETSSTPGEYILPIVDPIIGNIDAQDITTGTVDGTVTLTGDVPDPGFNLVLQANPPEGGTVTGAGEYDEGTEVDVDAIPNAGWFFVDWTDIDGNFVSDQPANTIVMPGEDLTLIANFEEDDDPDPDPENIMLIPDITANAGEVVTIELVVENDEEFVGFSVDVPLPEGFNFVEGSAELFRGTNHDFVFNVIEGNIAKIIAFSITNEAFQGNEGTVFSFDVETPDMPGDYPLQLVGAVLGNADAEDITTGSFDGTLTLLGVENIMKIHDITADAGNIITVEVEIMNDSEFVGFNLDVPLPDGFSYVEDSAQLFREDDHDFGFNITANNVAKIIAFSITNSAFAGNDGVIFSFDLETPGYAGEYVLEIVDGVIGNANAQNIITGTIDGTVTLEGEALPENIMLIPDITAEAGNEVTIEIVIENDEEFAGFSVDVPLPEGFEYVEGSAELFRGTNHDFVFNVIPGNIAKIIAFSITNESFLGNEGAIFSFNVQTPNVAGDYPLQLVDGVIGNADAEDITTGTIDGTLTLTEGVPSENIMQIHDITANAGEVITVELEIMNDEEFVGFNLDIPLPAGFNYVEGTAELFRGTDHDFAFNVIEGNVAKIIAFSITNDVFGGNEGIIFSFDVETPNVAGEYTLSIVDGVIGNIDAQDILTGTIDGTVILEGDGEPENIIKINDITADAGDIVTYEIEVMNDEEVAGFSVDVPLPEGFEYVEGTAELFRGTNHDFVFNVIPGNIAKIIAFSITNEAFTGNDGIIFSFDVQTTNVPGEYPLELVDAVLGNADAEDITTGVINGTLTLEGEIPSDNIMKIHDVTANVGDVITVELEIMNDNEFVGFNLDIPLPDGFNYVEGTAELFRKTNHDFVFNVIEATNLAKIISFSITNDAFLGNDGVIFSFDVTTPNAPGEYLLPIVDGIIGNAEAEDILTGTIDGTVTLEGDPIEEYTLTLMANPDNGGTVTGGGDYLAGEEVVISATPNTGWTFINWTDTEGNFISDEVTHVYTMPEEDITLWANFEEIDYEVVVNINPAGAGTVTGEGIYNYDERVTLVATANEGYAFENWADEDGNVVFGDATYIFDMPAEDVTLIANFEMIDYTLTLIANPEEGGTVTGAGVYNVGDEVDVDAIPNDGWHFVNWTDEDGNVVSDQPANTLEMPAADVTLIANFEMTTYTLTFVVLDESTGDDILDAVITLDGVEYDPGVYVFEDLLPGAYDYIVNRAGYFAVEDEAEITDNDVTVTVELEIDDTSVVDIELLDLSIFPNPASTILTIESNLIISDIRMIDMLGQVVYNATVDYESHEINVSGFRNGVYFIQVNTGAGLSTHRVQVVN